MRKPLLLWAWRWLCLSQTRQIRVVANTPCHEEVGVNPTATTSSAYLPAHAWTSSFNPGEKIAVTIDTQVPISSGIAAKKSASRWKPRLTLVVIVRPRRASAESPL